MTKEEKQEEHKDKKVLVMAEVPKQELRVLVDKDSGEEYEVMSIEEALTEILDNTRKIKKSLV